MLKATRTLLPASIKGYLKERIYKNTLQNFKTEIMLQSKSNSHQAFCIVHWNAPDFLLLNVNQIETLHPESKIYVLDNGSQELNLCAVKNGLEQFDNVTLICAKPPKKYLYSGLEIILKPLGRLVAEFRGHTIGLQFLLNYSAQQSDKIAVFLDQDCILSNRIDSLAAKLNGNLLVGARDDVSIPKDYGPLKRGKLRDAHHLVHASFMILQPKRIHELFGDCSLYHPKAIYEPYHGICYKTQGRILFLEARMHDEIPLLTSYSYQGVTYAWHAWYSSRTFGLSSQDSIDRLPVSWLQTVRKLAYGYMEQIHKATIAREHARNKSELNN